jgi:hypothetical protein
MSEPADFYSDLASINVSSNGMTLIFLRSMPAPRGTIDSSGAFGIEMGADGHPLPDQGGMASKPIMNFEMVARIRISPPFAVALRDLLTRTLDQLIARDAEVHSETSADPSAVDPNA